MNLTEAKEVLLCTHLAALGRGERASGYVLESPPGVGKTQSQFQYVSMLATALNTPCALVQFMVATITSPDARGFMLPLKPEPGKPLRTVFSIPPWYPDNKNTFVVTPDGTWYGPGEWTGELPEYGVVFLDEWGQGDEDVRKPLAELILNGNVGTTFLPLGWRVVAAQNRMSDRSGVVREMMFIVNRRCLLKIQPDLPTWLDWVDDQPDEKRPHFLSVSFARKNPNVVFGESVPDGTDPFCTARTLCLMDRDLQALASDEDRERNRMPMTDLAREVCAGWIGQGSAGQYFTHLKYQDEIPEPEDVASQPRQAKLPKGHDAQMVTAYMLAHSISEDNARNYMRYVLRLAVDMQVLAVNVIAKDETRRRHLAVVPEYAQWITDNRELLAASHS